MVMWLFSRKILEKCRDFVSDLMSVCDEVYVFVEIHVF